MKIRPFQAGDEQPLFQVYLSAIQQLASGDYTSDQIAAWADAGRDPAEWAHFLQALRPFVVVRQGKILAYADLQATGQITHFFVSGACARQGVGSALMLCLHEEARGLRLNLLRANVSKTAEPFFTHHGFCVVERRLPVRSGVVLENALMHKKL